jgi:hypothetical protein
MENLGWRRIKMNKYNEVNNIMIRLISGVKIGKIKSFDPAKRKEYKKIYELKYKGNVIPGKIKETFTWTLN